nr:hypothetical protein [Tanacetum cinerariifolium]
MPPKPDLVFHNAPNDVETVHTAFHVELSPTKPDKDLSPTPRPLTPIIEDWVSDSEADSEAQIPQNVPSFVQPIEQVKSPRPSVQHVETSILTTNPMITIQKPTSNGNRRNRKACFVFTAVVPKPHVTRPRQAKPIVTKPHSPPRRHINRSPSPKASNFPLKVTDVMVPRVNAAKGVHGNWDKGVIDSGCSRHVIGNMSHLSNFEELNGGNVFFGGNPKGGKISGKEKAREENVQQYVLFPVWSSGSTNPQNTDGDAAFDEKEPEFEGKKPESEVNVSPSSSAQSKKHDDKTKRESKVPVVGQISTNNTNTFSAAGPSNATVKADFNNLETSITVSHILTTRVHKDHHVTQIIGDLSSATQTRSMTWVVKDQEPNRVHQALKDPSWIKAMLEELLQFKMQNVWVLVDLPHRKRAIGHTREEGIDYEEVFAPVARIEAIRLFLAYASFMGFMVYQMDVKSAFMYGTIEEEVYVCQPPGFKDPDYPDKVYKVVKALYGLHQAPRACHDKYVAETLRKFGLTDGKLASTPIDTEKPLLKDHDAKDVDVHTYRSMIGSLMYLTSSRLDIMFAIYACARFQVTPKASHLHAVKRIFRYLKGKPRLGLWYPKDSPFNLVAYLDNDYAGASLDRKSTSGGCINCLPNDEIFIELARIGYEKPSTKLTFYKAFFLSQWKFLIHTILQCMSEKRTSWNKFSSYMASDVICLSTDVSTAGVAAAGAADDERVKKLERRNKLKASKLRRLKKVGTEQRIKTSDDTVIDDVSKQGRIIADMDADKDVTLKDVAVVAKDVQDAEIKEITTASATITAAAPQLTTAAAPTLTTAPSAARRRKGVVIRDPEETATPYIIIHFEAKSKEKRKGTLVEEPKPLKKQAQIEQDEAYAREKNMMIYLRNVARFKMDYFKGMTYDDIHPIFEKKFNSNVAFLQKTKEHIEEEDSRALKRLSKTQEEKAAKKQKLDEEVAKIKRHLQIVPNDDDDVYTEATPLARKVPVVDYEIYTENNKPYYKFIRADGSP